MVQVLRTYAWSVENSFDGVQLAVELRRCLQVQFISWVSKTRTHSVRLTADSLSNILAGVGDRTRIMLCLLSLVSLLAFPVVCTCSSSDLSWMIVARWSCVMIIVSSAVGGRHNKPTPPASWPFTLFAIVVTPAYGLSFRITKLEAAYFKLLNGAGALLRSILSDSFIYLFLVKHDHLSAVLLVAFIISPSDWSESKKNVQYV